MVKRTSKQYLREVSEKARALADFLRTPRTMGVLFAHDDIEPPFALRVSHNEEPHEVFMCSDHQQCELTKAWQINKSLRDFEEAFRQHMVMWSPWGIQRKVLDDYTPDYFDSYTPEDRGDPGLEILRF